MQDQNPKTQDNPTAAPSIDEVVAQATQEASKPTTPPKVDKPAETSKDKPATKPAPGIVAQDDFVRRIIDKIKDAENILVALSRDPSVDEMAAAIGLTMFLDSLQKHTTAIYSGQTPDALQFLQPGDTFESNTDSLQDFIIALSKDKADHLRYKLDGDFVKVYITPYKTILTENDLEFSHGDYNVDLVLAIGVPSAGDLDEALSEYGRIMHDATTIDITCDVPGRFGEIEWSDPGASSVSEMITKLIFAMQGKDVVLDKEIATALLTGIVAATGRFSNNRTNSDTMQLASKLMSMGADQQLIASHVMDNDSGVNEGPSFADFEVHAPVMPAADKNNLLVGKDYAGPEVTPVPAEPTPTVVTPDVVAPEAAVEVPPSVTVPPVTPSVNPEFDQIAAQNAVKQAVETAAANAAAASAGPKDYAAMIDEALAEPLPMATPASAAGLINNPAPTVPAAAPMAQPAATMPTQPVAQPATPVAQTGAPVAANPNLQAVPNAEPVEMPNQVVLPPPPAPPADLGSMPPVLPPVQPASNPAPVQAATPAQPGADPAANPAAFQIPGMPT